MEVNSVNFKFRNINLTESTQLFSKHLGSYNVILDYGTEDLARFILLPMIGFKKYHDKLIPVLLRLDVLVYIGTRDKPDFRFSVSKLTLICEIIGNSSYRLTNESTKKLQSNIFKYINNNNLLQTSY